MVPCHPAATRDEPCSFGRDTPGLGPGSVIISRKLEVSKQILCISVDTEADGSIDRAFLISRKAFDLNGMCIFSEHDEVYKSCLNKDESVESTVISLLRQQMVH